jgi:parallel beta-helix repeat protein
MGICKMSLCLGGKGCIIAVILLLAGLSIVPDLDANRTFDNTIYVDDDNIEGPWDGTTENPYQHIQDGIDAASDDDTVYVYSGLYYENVVVDKSIDLIGEGRDTTIVDGNETAFVIKIDADSVTLCNFTVQNGGIESSAVGGIMVESNCNSITSNNVYDNCIGIHLIHSNNNIICGNEISFNLIPGIRLLDSTNNIISGNIVDSNGLDVLQYYLVPGIKLEQSSNNTLLDNIFSNNAVGISLTYSSNNNIISGNDVKNNEYDGINLTDSSYHFRQQ